GTLCHLVEQPHVLNRDHRLVGEGLQELDLSVGEQPGLSAGDRNAPNGTAVSQYRDAYGTAIAADRCHRAKGVVGVRVNIRDLRDTSLKYRASRHADPTWRRGKCTSVDLEHIGGEAVVRHKVEEMTVKPVDKTVLGVAEPRRALGDHVKYRLDVSQRAADNVEHVAGCCLVFESFAQFLRARLHLVEQPHVLDRDQRLVGKSGDELDLPVRERLDVIALQADDGDHYAVAQQRNPEHGAIAADLLGLQHVVLGISHAIRQVNRFSLNRGSADQRAASRSYRMLKEVFDIVSPDVVGPHQVVFAVLQLEEKGMFRLAQARRCLQDGINYWLQLVGRARNDVEHVTDRSLIVERFLDLARARLHLVEQPHVLDRDHRLVGEGGGQLDLLVGEWPHLGALQGDSAHRDPLAEHRHSQCRPKASELLRLGPGVVGIVQHVRNVDDPALQQRASGDRSALEPDGNVLDVLHVFRGNAVPLRPIEHATDLTGDCRLIGFAQARGRLDERLQHRLEIERRAADDPEHVGGRSLLLQRFAQFVEQASVLDRDDGLRGEILHQLDLLFRE